MNTKRRTFMQSVAAVSALVGTPLSVMAVSKNHPDVENLAGTNVAPFADHLGGKAHIIDSEGLSFSAIVEEVAALEFHDPERPAHLAKCAHVVRFKTSVNLQSEALYQVSVAGQPATNIMMTAVPDANGVLGLEAIFN